MHGGGSGLRLKGEDLVPLKCIKSPVALTAVRSKAVVLLLLIRGKLLLPSWDSVIVLCFVVRSFVSILILQSSRWGRESWLLCFACLPGVSWLLCGSSSRCLFLMRLAI